MHVARRGGVGMEVSMGINPDHTQSFFSDAPFNSGAGWCRRRCYDPHDRGEVIVPHLLVYFQANALLHDEHTVNELA